MAIFSGDETDWSRVDYSAIGDCGYVCIDENDADVCRSWLTRHGYAIHVIDCSVPFEDVRAQFSRLLRFEEQFGYSEYRGSLDALADAFDFQVPNDGGVVLELRRPDLLAREQGFWVKGLLGIIDGYSRVEMASGRRFFATLLIPRDHLALARMGCGDCHTFR